MSKQPYYWNVAKRHLVKKDQVMKKLIKNYSEKTGGTAMHYINLYLIL